MRFGLQGCNEPLLFLLGQRPQSFWPDRSSEGNHTSSNDQGKDELRNQFSHRRTIVHESKTMGCNNQNDPQAAEGYYCPGGGVVLENYDYRQSRRKAP
jgi:hypothetical protein